MFSQQKVNCEIIQKKKAKILKSRIEFLAVTCIFKMEKGYKNFAHYYNNLIKSCECNKTKKIIIRIYYDSSIEDSEMKAFHDFENVELIKYNFPQIKTGKFHPGTFGTMMRLLPLFDADYAVCTCFDADMILDYKSITLCIKKMEDTESFYYALFYDCPSINDSDKKFGKNVIDEYIMATYVAFPQKLQLPKKILGSFIKKAFCKDKMFDHWIKINKITNGTVFVYGIDEFFMNKVLLPEIHKRSNIIGTRLYMTVRKLHYELYKAVENQTLSGQAQKIENELKNIFSLSGKFPDLIKEIDHLMTVKYLIFEKLNNHIHIYKKYMDLLVNLEQAGIIKYTDEQKICVNYNKNREFIDEVYIFYKAGKLGGSYKNTVIIVPFAEFHKDQERGKQLKMFLDHMKSLENKITILIAEQIEPDKFNKGRIYNAAVKHIFQKFNRIILHDVDILPNEKMYELYTAADLQMPSMLVPFTEYYKEKYQDNVIPVGGGVTAICVQDYIKINGFPNNFWNWGGEDNAFRKRLKSKGIWYYYSNRGDFITTDLQRINQESKIKYVIKNNLLNKEKDNGGGFRECKAEIISEKKNKNIIHIKLKF